MTAFFNPLSSAGTLPTLDLTCEVVTGGIGDHDLMCGLPMAAAGIDHTGRVRLLCEHHAARYSVR